MISSAQLLFFQLELSSISGFLIISDALTCKILPKLFSSLLIFSITSTASLSAPLHRYSHWMIDGFIYDIYSALQADSQSRMEWTCSSWRVVQHSLILCAKEFYIQFFSVFRLWFRSQTTKQKGKFNWYFEDHHAHTGQSKQEKGIRVRVSEGDRHICLCWSVLFIFWWSGELIHSVLGPCSIDKWANPESKFLFNVVSLGKGD